MLITYLDIMSTTYQNHLEWTPISTLPQLKMLVINTCTLPSIMKSPNTSSHNVTSYFLTDASVKLCIYSWPKGEIPKPERPMNVPQEQVFLLLFLPPLCSQPHGWIAQHRGGGGYWLLPYSRTLTSRWIETKINFWDKIIGERFREEVALSMYKKSVRRLISV